VVVVEGVTLATLVAGPSTMIIIGILLNVAGLGACCWARFTLAVYALPFFVGMTVGIYTYQIGIGLIGAIVVGFFAGALGLLAGQHIFSACTFFRYSSYRCLVVCRSCGVRRL
jgi:hypothetical protein